MIQPLCNMPERPWVPSKAHTKEKKKCIRKRNVFLLFINSAKEKQRKIIFKIMYMYIHICMHIHFHHKIMSIIISLAGHAFYQF